MKIFSLVFFKEDVVPNLPLPSSTAAVTGVASPLCYVQWFAPARQHDMFTEAHLPESYWHVCCRRKTNRLGETMENPNPASQTVTFERT